MHTYRMNDKKEFEVGFYRRMYPTDSLSWIIMKRFEKEKHALAYTNYLNGGAGEFPKSWGLVDSQLKTMI